MGRVTYTTLARRDRVELWLYIATDNPATADSWLDDIDAKLSLLADAPDLGRARDDIAPGIRSFPVGNYLILYTPRPHCIHVARIVHGARFLPWLV